jgi:hypothetical protein
MVTSDLLWRALPSKTLTTGIGSLPHHNVDSAITYSFSHSIPFLPQIPIRNAKEYMLSQSLDGLPGLKVQDGGSIVLDLPIWTSGYHALKVKLQKAFEKSLDHQDSFEEFEPNSIAFSTWKPFLFELSERAEAGHAMMAKIQLAGPLTCQWALSLSDGTKVENMPDLGLQIFELILAKAIAMSRKLLKRGISPLFYLDEPALYVLSLDNPLHRVALTELRLFIQSLRKEGVLVGLHCCSNMQWQTILGLGLNVISLDTHLSLVDFLKCTIEVSSFLERGGRISFGIIPTGLTKDQTGNIKSSELKAELKTQIESTWRGNPDLMARAVKQGIYTAACGLALETPDSAEEILGRLKEF